jgi:hypothetical protein
MINVKLTRVSSLHQNLRTDFAEGVTSKLPEVGEHFVLYGESLTDPSLTRQIITSVVEHVHQSEGCYLFETQNSEYVLEVLPETTPSLEETKRRIDGEEASN